MRPVFYLTTERTAEIISIMRIHRLIPFLLLVGFVTLSSCSTVQNAWYDFNAYFNTYYNAQNHFDEGVRQVENQTIDYNPERPIRIHPTPPEVGQSDFEMAAEKGADIVHMHENSRYVDNAIELIGKAYFYQQEYFSAGQNFDEIYNNAIDPTRRQNAVMWRGRVFMEMEEYTPGISYLVNHLYSGELEWEPEIKAEVQLVLAQFYTYVENWQDAEEYLIQGLENFDDRQAGYRAWFLLGQVQERLEKWDEAQYAYTMATETRNEDFDLRYHADMKKGEMMRQRGEYQLAYDHFYEMARNDNYYEELGDIEYQKAKSLHESGNIEEAIEEYELALRQELNPPSQKMRALIYYNLGKIHRDVTLDYTLAAAYFDSSRTTTPAQERMPIDFDAELMAESFGEYAELKHEKNHLDSLLWLGSLDEEEFNEVVDQVRERKIEEMEREMREQQTSGDVVVDQEDMQETDEVEGQDENGFLNHLNQERMNRGMQQFNAYWGNRPLVDDWRRGEAVRLAIRERETEEEIEEDDVVLDPQDMDEEEALAQQVTVDISEVPFEQEEQEDTHSRIASVSYEIGNVFFLSLSMPDSAAANYKRVIENYPDSELISQSLYSLTEVYLTMDDSTMARQYAEQLIDEHPSSIYARRISERMNLDLPEEYLAEAESDTANVAWQDLQEQVDEDFSDNDTEELKQFASTYPESDKAPIALYHASMSYIQRAKEDTLYAKNLERRDEKKAEWEEKESHITEMRDSANVVLDEDTTLTDDEIEYWRSWADSSVSEPDYSDYDPYQHAYWDSARVVLAKITDEYQDFSLNGKMTSIQDEIGRPPEPESEEDEEEEADNGEVAEEPDYDYVGCDDLDEQPEVLGGVSNFFERSGFQETIDQMMLSGEFDVTVIMDEEGYVIDVIYTDEDDPLGFMDELSEAMLDDMRLSPPNVDGESTKARCTISLELSYSD